MAQNYDVCIESSIPIVSINGLNTNTAVDFSGASTVALPAATTINGSTVTSLGSITSTSATAFTVASTSTNYGLQIDESTTSAITGLKIKAAASGNGVALSALGGTNEPIKIDGKAAGQVIIGATSTGLVSIGRGSVKTTLFSSTVASLGTTQNSTPTAAQLLGGVVTQTGATGAGTVTLPTGSVLSTAISGVTVGDTFECLFVNLGGSQTLTLTAGATGMTMVGTVAVASGTNAKMTFVNTSSNTWSVYVVVSA